jgi:hypothetical protein
VLSNPKAATARKIPWVAALHSYAASISPAPTGAGFQFKVNTGGQHLSASQLPLASGAAPPSFAGSAPIVFALRDPGQAVSFAESAEQATDPAKYAKFLKRQATLQHKTGVNLTTLFKLFTGDLIIDSNTRQTIGRVQLSDPAAAKSALAKLASHPDDVFTTPTTVTREGGGFYALKERPKAVSVGIVGDQLVAGQASPSQLRAFATAPTQPATGAVGALAFRIALADVVRLESKRAPSAIESQVLKLLGDFTGSSEATPSGLSGSATVTVNSH